MLVGPQPLRVDALVLESVSPTLEEAIDNRLAIRPGPLGPPLAPLLTAQLRPRLGGFLARHLRDGPRSSSRG